MEAIAAEAGVAPRTVYSAFGAKREILSAICEKWLEQAHARELAMEAMAEADPRQRLRAAAHWLRALYEAGFDVVTLFAAASDDDAETRALLRAKLAGRNEVMDAMIASLEGELSIPTAQAQAIYRALAAPDVYGELVTESQWTPAAFEEWVAETLLRQLLDPAR
jgi:AcrR family transcriptional regulator